MNFGAYVRSIEKLYQDALSVQLPALPKLSASLADQPKKILILAPHPDDECLMSGFAIRAKEEYGAWVGVQPFSFGSDLKRRADRAAELKQALLHLKFDLVDSRTSGDDELTELDILSALDWAKPDLVILPHVRDGHPTHIRCSQLGVLAVKAYVSRTQSSVHVLYSEFWQSMDAPTMVVPLSADHVIQMGEALMCHAGEVSRNPYHLTMPAFLMDQIRRGSEMASTSGSQAAFGKPKIAATFGQIYGHQKFGP